MKQICLFLLQPQSNIKVFSFSIIPGAIIEHFIENVAWQNVQICGVFLLRGFVCIVQNIPWKLLLFSQREYMFFKSMYTLV